jgi:hypothetical protein
VESVPTHLKFFFLILIAYLTSYLEFDWSLAIKIFESYLFANAIPLITESLEITIPLLGTT